MKRIKVNTFINKEFDFGKYKIQLDKYQYNVVKSDINKNLRIIACAGSGKTTTILCRIKYIIDNGIDPKRILLTTFNVDASDTLKERLKALLNKDVGIRIGTFDSISAYFYFKYFKIDGFVGVNEYVNLLIKYLNSENGKNILNNYDYIFFDEFQDINNEQFQVIKKFYENGSKIIAIGDDAQNIYQWRGSNIDYILNFDKIFDNTQTFKLENNYRSTPEIINLATAIIKNNSDQIDKNMIPNKNSGHKPIITKYKTPLIQATSIIDKIKKLLDNNIKNSDIIVISRNNYGLKIFEEQLELYNRDNDNKIDYIALITDNDKNYNATKNKNNSKNKITLATIHKVKGGEWNYVFIIDLDDKTFPSDCDNIGIQEERRLLYVAITRAKIYLEMSFCSNNICRFISEIDKDLYNFTNFKKSYFDFNDKRSIQIKTKVTELIQQLKNSDYDNMRSTGIISNFNPSEDKIHSPNKIDDNILSNNLQSDYGIYIDTYISRQFGLKNNNSNGLENNVAKCIIYSIELNHIEYAIYLESKLQQNLLIYGENCLSMMNITNQWSKSKINILFNILDKIINKSIKLNVKPHELYVTKYGFLPHEFTKSMLISYNEYIKNINIDTLHIYNISLCPNIFMNRRRLLYKNCFDMFNYNTKIYDDINIFCDKYFKNNIIIKLTTYDKENTICCELDMYDATLKKIVDFKTSSSKTIQMDWILQLLTYCSLLRLYNKLVVDYVSIYNPISGYEYIIDVRNWKKEKELLNILANTREEKINKIDKNIMPNKKEKKKDKKIVKNNDIRLDFLDDDEIKEYYKMKNNKK